MPADIELRWTTTDTATSVATDHAVATNDPNEWPPNYPMFDRTIFIDATLAASLGCPSGWYEHITENGTQVALGVTLPIWVYKKMP